MNLIAIYQGLFLTNAVAFFFCRKLYTAGGCTPTSGTSVPAVAARRTLLKGMRRSLTTAAMASPSPQKKGGRDNNYLVKRLAHYTSMADALLHTKEKQPNNNCQKSESDVRSQNSELNLSDKENSTPVGTNTAAKNYRLDTLFRLIFGVINFKP